MAKKTYRTESSFKKALRKYTASGELVHWYGTDHGWVIETKKVYTPKRANPRNLVPAKILVDDKGRVRVFVAQKHAGKRNPFDWRESRAAKSTGSLYDAIRHGSRVTIVNRFGQERSGKAVMRGPAGWVLNMGGAHGTPGIATPENVVRVKS